MATSTWEEKNLAKHILICKFKDGTSKDTIDELVIEFADLKNLIPYMKSFLWGEELGVLGETSGYTHFFECTFESSTQILEYINSDAHNKFADKFLPQCEKYFLFDYIPTLVKFE